MRTIFEKYKTRESNIELLRIASIFFIVLSHWAVHSDFAFDTSRLTVNQLLIEWSTLGEIGVCVFVLISGYYSVSRNQTVKGFFNLFFKVWSYNIIILAVVYFGRIKELSLRESITSLVPIFNLHWFAYTFLILYVLMPFLNAFIHNSERGLYEKLLIVVFLSWSIIYSFTGADFGFSYLGWFVFLYLLGAYIRLYRDETVSTGKLLLVFLSSLVVLMASAVCINIVGLRIGFYPKHGADLYSLHSPFVLICAISLFILFKNIEIGRHAVINLLASTSFGIYLLSDNPLIRKWIWNDLFVSSSFAQSHLLILVGVGCVIAVMSICMVFDLIWKIVESTKVYGRIIGQAESLVLRAMYRISAMKIRNEE